MNSVFCRYSSLDPALIQEIIDVFRDGDDQIDMHQVHKALQEMCPASDQELASRQYELAQRPLDVTSPTPRALDVSTPSPMPPPPNIDRQAGHSGINDDIPSQHISSAPSQCSAVTPGVLSSRLVPRPGYLRESPADKHTHLNRLLLR